MLLAGSLALALSACTGNDGEDSAEPPPDVVTADFGQVMQECMAAKGWTVEVLPDGQGIVSDVPPEQAPQRRAALDECSDEHGFSDPPPPQTPEQLRDNYAALLDTAECLRGEGHVIEDPPSEEVFVETAGAAWHPYTSVDVTDMDEWYRLNEVCPQPG